MRRHDVARRDLGRRMWPLLTDDDLWHVTTDALQTVVTGLMTDAAVWLQAFPPPSLSISVRMATFQARLGAIPWTVWSTPSGRQGPLAASAQEDLRGAFLQGRLISGDADLRRTDPALGQRLYQVCDDWHNVPQVLNDVPWRLNRDPWVLHLLRPGLKALSTARVQHERTLLDKMARSSMVETADRPFRARF